MLESEIADISIFQCRLMLSLSCCKNKSTRVIVIKTVHTLPYHINAIGLQSLLGSIVSKMSFCNVNDP